MQIFPSSHEGVPTQTPLRTRHPRCSCFRHHRIRWLNGRAANLGNTGIQGAGIPIVAVRRGDRSAFTDPVRAEINGAEVSVVAQGRTSSAETGIARVAEGAWVSVIAGFRVEFLDAIPALRLTHASGANVFILALDFFPQTNPRNAFVLDCTEAPVITGAFEGLVQTALQFIALLFCARIVIVAGIFLLEDHTSSERITKLLGACISIVAVDRNPFTDSFNARVLQRTGIVVRAGPRGCRVNAPNLRFAGIECAPISVITGIGKTDTDPGPTEVSHGADLVIIAGDGWKGVVASLSRDTSFFCARVIVVAIHGIPDADPSLAELGIRAGVSIITRSEGRRIQAADLFGTVRRRTGVSVFARKGESLAFPFRATVIVGAEKTVIACQVIICEEAPHNRVAQIVCAKRVILANLGRAGTDSLYAGLTGGTGVSVVALSRSAEFERAFP